MKKLSKTEKLRNQQEKRFTFEYWRKKEMARVSAEQFKDKNFVLSYLENIEDGNALSAKLREDQAPINALEVVVQLGKWLREAENKTSSDSSAKYQARETERNLQRDREADKKAEEEKRKQELESAKALQNEETGTKGEVERASERNASLESSIPTPSSSSRSLSDLAKANQSNQ